MSETVQSYAPGSIAAAEFKSGFQARPLPPRGSRIAAPFRAVAQYTIVRAAGRRLLLAIPLLFVVSIFTEILVSLIPGNPGYVLLGNTATAAQVAALDRRLGLTLPLYEQYWHWLHHAVAGNLGTSYYTGQPVVQAIQSHIWVTISLIIGTMSISLILGVALGTISALRGGALGKALDTFALLGFALPGFWIGAELILFFAVKIRLFPATGYVTFNQSPAGWLHSLVLPVAALCFGGIAFLSKQTREAMMDTLGSEYITMARASGVSARSIVWRHALRNCSVRIVTVLGIQAVSLIAGTVIVENVFGLPGLGTLAVAAAGDHDIITIQGIVVIYTLMVVAINLLVDVAYSLLDPRVGVG